MRMLRKQFDIKTHDLLSIHKFPFDYRCSVLSSTYSLTLTSSDGLIIHLVTSALTAAETEPWLRFVS
jgi:hypothetical protein